jgi:hypothetical protein
MNAQDVLMYGHLMMLHTLDTVPMPAWEIQGVCGWWSVKNIVGHLTAYEWMLEDVLKEILGQGPTACLDEMRQTGPEAFNAAQVEQRQGQTAQEALSEYNAAYAAVQEMVAHVAPKVLREAGRLPWYGMEYAVDDLIVYQYYGHKREHMAQVEVFRDRQASPGS